MSINSKNSAEQCKALEILWQEFLVKSTGGQPTIADLREIIEHVHPLADLAWRALMNHPQISIDDLVFVMVHVSQSESVNQSIVRGAWNALTMTQGVNALAFFEIMKQVPMLRSMAWDAIIARRPLLWLEVAGRVMRETDMSMPYRVDSASLILQQPDVSRVDIEFIIANFPEWRREAEAVRSQKAWFVVGRMKECLA